MRPTLFLRAAAAATLLLHTVASWAGPAVEAAEKQPLNLHADRKSVV